MSGANSIEAAETTTLMPRSKVHQKSQNQKQAAKEKSAIAANAAKSASAANAAKSTSAANAASAARPTQAN